MGQRSSFVCHDNAQYPMAWTCCFLAAALQLAVDPPHVSSIGSCGMSSASHAPQLMNTWPLQQHNHHHRDVRQAMFGFVDWAEKMNSRAAMIGFFALLAVEGAAGKPFLTLIGWDIGNGINVGF